MPDLSAVARAVAWVALALGLAVGLVVTVVRGDDPVPLCTALGVALAAAAEPASKAIRTERARRSGQHQTLLLGGRASSDGPKRRAPRPPPIPREDPP